jgi:DNA-binding MarR family transcriptional regulator
LARSDKEIRLELFEDAAYGSLRRLLWYAFVRVNERVLEELGEVSLSAPLATAMRNMDLDGTRISVMAERAGITKQAMGVFVRELEGLGLVTVSVDGSDRRARVVCYTEAGLAMVARFVRADEVVERELIFVLGADMVERLKGDLRRVVRS